MTFRWDLLDKVFYDFFKPVLYIYVYMHVHVQLTLVLNYGLSKESVIVCNDWRVWNDLWEQAQTRNSLEEQWPVCCTGVDSTVMHLYILFATYMYMYLCSVLNRTYMYNGTWTTFVNMHMYWFWSWIGMYMYICILPTVHTPTLQTVHGYSIPW